MLNYSETLTPFGLYVDKDSNWIEILGDSGTWLVGIIIMNVFADDFVLISYSLEGLQRHLNASKSFLHRRVCVDEPW